MKAKKKMSMYKNGGFNPQPDTSYQSPASKSARAKSANKAKQIGESYEQAFRGDMKARQAARFAIKEFGKGDRAGRGGKMDELYDKMIKRKAVAERARQKAKALSNKDLSEFKEYKGGGMMYGKKGMKVKKYQEGGMNATGETRRGLRPKNPLSQEEIAKLGRQKRSEAAREDKRKMSYSNAGKMVIDSPFHSASQSQAKIDFRQKKALAEMGVEGLAKFFGSEMYKGKGPKPSREQIEKFVTKYSK